MTYSNAALSHLTFPVVRRDAANVVIGAGRDPLTPSRRAAVERKRDAAKARDLARFIRATAHLPSDEFPDDHWHLFLPGPPDELLEGLGRRRRTCIRDMMRVEHTRRAARTAHQVIAERRLAQPSVNKS